MTTVSNEQIMAAAIGKAEASNTPSSPERPIQAGDWVECVDDGGFSALAVGNRFVVRGVGKVSGGRPALDIGCGRGTAYLASRFKRVDGPHHEKRFGESEEICTSCSEGGCFREQTCEMAGNGKWYCVHCIDGAREQHGVEPEAQTRYEAGDPRAERYCKECGVTVVAGPGCEFPLCAGCTERRNPSPKVDPYRAHNISRQPDNGAIHDEAHNVAARKKLAAWELADRPRPGPVNLANRREFARPHPWECFDEMESR